MLGFRLIMWNFWIFGHIMMIMDKVVHLYTGCGLKKKDVPFVIYYSATRIKIYTQNRYV